MRHNKKNLTLLENEIQTGINLKHEGIAELLEIHETCGSVYLIFELLDGGVITGRRKEIESLKNIRNIMFSLINCLDYLKDRRVVHRDLKPLNILYENEKDYKVKIIDFGLSCSHFSYQAGRCGTAGFIPPEMFSTKTEHLPGIMNEKIDVFSIGVIFYYFLYGVTPYQDECEEIVLERNIKGVFKFLNLWEQKVDKVSPEAQNLVENMLKIDPGERFSIEQCLNHNFFSVFNLESTDIQENQSFQKFNCDSVTPDIEPGKKNIKKIKKAFEELFE